MGEEVLTIAQAAEIVPLAKSTLYRLAREGEAPFRMRKGRWMVLKSDLLSWVREGDHKPRLPSNNPMPNAAGLLEEIRQRRTM